MKKCLNVGSGTDYKPSTETEEWVNIDPNPAVHPDHICAVEELKRSIFSENEFDEVHLIHVWEHCHDLIWAIENIWHVLKPGGKLIIVTPYFTAESAYSDPTHKHLITPVTFAFLSYPCYEENARTGSRMSQLFPECDFDIKRRAVVPCAKPETFKDEDFAVRHYFNVLEEIQVELECVKPIRKFDLKQYQKRIA